MPRYSMRPQCSWQVREKAGVRPSYCVRIKSSLVHHDCPFISVIRVIRDVWPHAAPPGELGEVIHELLLCIMYVIQGILLCQVYLPSTPVHHAITWGVVRHAFNLLLWVMEDDLGCVFGDHLEDPSVKHLDHAKKRNEPLPCPIRRGRCQCCTRRCPERST